MHGARGGLLQFVQASEAKFTKFKPQSTQAYVGYIHAQNVLDDLHSDVRRVVPEISRRQPRVHDRRRVRRSRYCLRSSFRKSLPNVKTRHVRRGLGVSRGFVGPPHVRWRSPTVPWDSFIKRAAWLRIRIREGCPNVFACLEPVTQLVKRRPREVGAMFPQEHLPMANRSGEGVVV